MFAHTVEANPVRVYRDGAASWAFNTNSTYMDAVKSKLNLFISDEWKPVPRLVVRTGIRLTPLYNDVFSAARLGGESLNARATWQNPKYKNYSNVFTFSDGSQAVLDYTGNTVTGISKLMVEFDPSYQWGNVRAWGSVRYDSRQYVSRTNLASFSGHFETFAGADWKITRSHSLSLSFVNLLMQSGAKGSIDIADTIDDPSVLDGYVMAGSYIRPFTVDLSYTYSF